MSDSVRARGDAIATFRFVCVHAMETLGRWVPTTPELEAKLLFGRHIWELAQHADQLGYRTHELRLALQASREPRRPYREALDAVRALQPTGHRVDSLYGVVLPSLKAHYEVYLDHTDKLLDEPSVRILERLLWDLERLAKDREALRAKRPDIPGMPPGELAALRHRFAGAEMIDYRPDPATVGDAT